MAKGTASLIAEMTSWLIAATALELASPLVTADERLNVLPGLRTVW